MGSFRSYGDGTSVSVSSKRLETLGIEIATPGLQGEYHGGFFYIEPTLLNI